MLQMTQRPSPKKNTVPLMLQMTQRPSPKKKRGATDAEDDSAAKSKTKRGDTDAADDSVVMQRFFNMPGIVHSNFMDKAKKLDARVDSLMENKKTIDPVRVLKLTCTLDVYEC